MVNEEKAELLTDDDLTVSVSSEMLAQACAKPDEPNVNLATLCENGHKCFEITSRGDETLSIVHRD